MHGEDDMLVVARQQGFDDPYWVDLCYRVFPRIIQMQIPRVKGIHREQYTVKVPFI